MRQLTKKKGKNSEKKSACEYVDLHCARPARYRHFNIVLTALAEHIFLLYYTTPPPPQCVYTFFSLYFFISTTHGDELRIHEYIINVSDMFSMSRFSIRSFISYTLLVVFFFLLSIHYFPLLFVAFTISIHDKQLIVILFSKQDRLF